MTADAVEHLELTLDLGPFDGWDDLACAAVCVGGRDTRAAVAAYAGKPTRVHTLVDVSAGLAKPTVRQIAAVAAAKDGAHGIELMASAWCVMNREFVALRDDLMSVVIAAREVSREVGVVVAVRSQWLSGEAGVVEPFCAAVRESGCDGVVVGGGSPSSTDAYERNVGLIGEHAQGLRVTATCPADERGEWRRWLERGCDRVGLMARHAADAR